ncbi:putative T7SS-secreted protein [Streptomyces sp. NBC_01198]|uniref:putative T7SS-secreted protein n=1 Tax=Streptomyces sp. NBC_01198 TaxID=2903769 RepID=UPI002E146836|nr:toxin glutamine deamidase domain-containing protein [Streptomyces sp. NBC_01198]
MGLGSLVNKIGDGGEKLLGKAKKKAGDLIDDGAHAVGDGLDHVGLHDAADWVDDHGDSIADHLGAHVDEQQLGQSEDPKELVHGDSTKIREVAGHLSRFHSAFDTGHTGLTHLDPGSWEGAGAEAFRSKFAPQPAKWAKAATACQDASNALEHYAFTVDWAQGQAKEAVRLWKQGTDARKRAADAYNAKVDEYNKDLASYKDLVDGNDDPGKPPVAPGAFVDPGAADKNHAKEILNAARKQRDTVAGEAGTKVRAATALAPAKPDFADRMKSDGGDFLTSMPIQAEHFAGGLIRSGTDMLKFVRGLNPYDPYNMTHPAQYLTHLNSTAAGLLDMTAHPERLPGVLLGTGWGSDGSEAGGRLVGNILMAIATDGGSAGAKAGVEGAGKEAAEQAAKDAAENGGKWKNLAKATSDVKGKAFHQGSMTPAEEAQFLHDEYPWLKDVNETGKPGYTDNCSKNVEAVNERLDGMPSKATPLQSPQWPSPTRLGNPSAQWENVKSYDDIINDMNARGDGSRGVVYINRGGSAHVFNVVKDSNGVVFLDGQSGRLADLEKGVSIQYMPYK